MARPRVADVQISLRVRQSDLERADALADLLAKTDLALALGEMSRAGVLRIALARGLAALETEYGKPKRSRH